MKVIRICCFTVFIRTVNAAKLFLIENFHIYCKVTHHPPGCAQHVEHKDWTFWQDYTMGSKFRGKYLQIIPYGEVCIK